MSNMFLVRPTCVHACQIKLNWIELLYLPFLWSADTHAKLTTRIIVRKVLPITTPCWYMYSMPRRDHITIKTLASCAFCFADMCVCVVCVCGGGGGYAWSVWWGIGENAYTRSPQPTDLCLCWKIHTTGKPNQHHQQPIDSFNNVV